MYRIVLGFYVLSWPGRALLQHPDLVTADDLYPDTAERAALLARLVELGAIVEIPEGG